MIVADCYIVYYYFDCYIVVAVYFYFQELYIRGSKAYPICRDDIDWNCERFRGYTISLRGSAQHDILTETAIFLWDQTTPMAIAGSLGQTYHPDPDDLANIAIQRHLMGGFEHYNATDNQNEENKHTNDENTNPEQKEPSLLTKNVHIFDNRNHTSFSSFRFILLLLL